MSKKRELKPCPFCGSEAQVNTWTMHGITESRCFCPNSDCPNSVRTVALATWNTRPIEDALNARIAELEAENDELKERVAMLDVTAVYKSLGEMGYIEQTNRLNARIAELEAENERLSQLLHDEMSQLEIATDLGNKRWIALNEIYEKSEKHSAWWCKRKAQEGLGIK